jgi:hypothetical protein
MKGKSNDLDPLVDARGSLHRKKMVCIVVVLAGDFNAHSTSKYRVTQALVQVNRKVPIDSRLKVRCFLLSISCLITHSFSHSSNDEILTLE